MKYSRDTTVRDLTTYEYFEGTPEEIGELVNYLDKPESVKQEININSKKTTVDSLKGINKKAQEVAFGI